MPGRRTSSNAPRVVAAPDKFRGTASAAEVAGAVARAASDAGWRCDRMPLADGGEGTLAALGGANRETVVTGPLGDPVTAAWRFDGSTAVIEMAEAAGLLLVGGPSGNDPIAAATTGVGELVMAAVESGAKRIIVGVGGSATTDGGLGALRALHPPRLHGVQLLVACDVRTTFVDAADVFAPQKGASPPQVELLHRRLERLVELYRDEHGVDVAELEGSGAAGGLAGGLAAAGATLVSGFELIAEEVGFFDTLEEADLVVTGEGFVDHESFEGKVVGGVVDAATADGVPSFVVAGRFFDDTLERVDGASLVSRYGEPRAREHTLDCIREVVAERLAAMSVGDRQAERST
jgi:glycerate kinase